MPFHQIVPSPSIALFQAQEGYFPFKTYEDLDGPVLDYRDSQPVYLTEFELNKFVKEQEKEDTKVAER